MRAQSAWFRRADPGDALFFQVGRFNEFDAPADDALAQGLGLRPLRANRRRTRYGFPIARARTCARRLLKAGRSLLVVAQTEQVCTGGWERRVVSRLEPNERLWSAATYDSIDILVITRFRPLRSPQGCPDPWSLAGFRVAFLNDPRLPTEPWSDSIAQVMAGDRKGRQSCSGSATGWLY